jgi:hypothetical protein
MQLRIFNVNHTISTITLQNDVFKKSKSLVIHSLWILCVQHVVYILNSLSTERLQWKTLIEAATGQQPDISAILAFHWYEPPVYYKHYKSSSASPSSIKNSVTVKSKLRFINGIKVYYNFSKDFC